MASIDAVVERVKSHLLEVLKEPLTKLDARLLESISGEAADSLDKDQRFALVNLIAAILQKIQQDPEPATRLAESLVSAFSFTDVERIEPAVELVAGLTAPAPSVQLLTLRLIGLAAHNVGDVAIIAGNLDLVRNLIDVWLRTSDIAVAARAVDVVTSLLLADSAPVPGTGLMQRRLFQDGGIYKLFYSHTSLKTTAQGVPLSKRDKTIAQGRLFDFLGRIWHVDGVWQSQILEIEEQYGLKPGQGLIHFAALHMIDQSDILLRRTQVDFFASLIRDTDPAGWAWRQR